MIAPLNFLKVSCLFLTSIVLLACNSSGSNSAKIPDINTFRIYTFDQVIYSFNEETGISTKRGEFDLGENQFIELNTDESKQGYEYAAYIFENTIYLLNYDKASNARTIELAELSSSRVICGITPLKTASRASFADNGKSNRSTLDLPIVMIEYKEDDQDCGSEFNPRDRLDFTSVIENAEATRDIVKSASTSDTVLGGHIIDYASYNSSLTLVDEETDKGSSGFLGKKTSKTNAEIVETLKFNFKIDGENDQWEKVLSPSAGVQVIKQVSNKQVLIQEGTEIYILKTPKLFTINTENSSTPIQDQIDAMFSSSYLTLENDVAIESNNSQNTDTFVLKQNNALYFYASGSFKQIPTNETPLAQSATKIKFDLTSDNTALVIQEANNIQTLIAIAPVTGLSATILSAEKIEFYIVGNEFYVNTLELEPGTGWQAHWFRKSNNGFAKTTYNNSRLLFIQNSQEELNSIYLLGSDNEVSDSNIIKPSLYKYDKNQNNGRKKGRSSNNGSVDFSFGQLNTDVSNVTDSIIVNDIYGKIILNGINEDSGVGRSVEEHYYFNPSQVIADPDIDEQSLTLIRRIVL